VLAATLAASWGMYAGYELCDGTVLQGEEYRDSEKYQLVDWRTRVHSDLRPLVRTLNTLRSEEAALQRDDGLLRTATTTRCLHGKRTADGSSQVAAVSLESQTRPAPHPAPLSATE
jgi:starch synthase (maltosyl-transferring)